MECSVPTRRSGTPNHHHRQHRPAAASFAASSSRGLSSVLLRTVLLVVAAGFLLVTTHVQPALSLSSSQRTTPHNPKSSGLLSRRDILGTTAAFAGGGGLAAPWLIGTQAAAAAADAAPTRGPVAVVGATGRTGSLCVDACLRRGIPVRALTRTGEWTAPPTPEGAVATFGGGNNAPSPPPNNRKLLSIARCDIVNDSTESLLANLEGCSAVIYAASASKNGGSAREVDHLGVVRVANACLEAGVGRCVLISSTATTRPKSLGYVFTNLGVGGNIMGEKRNGELGLAAAYERQPPRSSSSPPIPSYTILRPGGLEEAKRNTVLGPSRLELSQGDVFSGIISRADVAELTVELALSTQPNVKNTALELYYTESAVPVENRYKPLLKSASVVSENGDNNNNNNPNSSKLRLHGDNYGELLTGIRSNLDYFAE